MADQIDLGRGLNMGDLGTFSIIDLDVHDKNHVTVMKLSRKCTHLVALLPQPLKLRPSLVLMAKFRPLPLGQRNASP